MLFLKHEFSTKFPPRQITIDVHKPLINELVCAKGSHILLTLSKPQLCPSVFNQQLLYFDAED